MFHQPFKLSAENLNDPKIEKPGDAVIRVTTLNASGSDLRPYEGRAPLEAGMALGHENTGTSKTPGHGIPHDQNKCSPPVLRESR